MDVKVSLCGTGWKVRIEGNGVGAEHQTSTSDVPTFLIISEWQFQMLLKLDVAPTQRNQHILKETLFGIQSTAEVFLAVEKKRVLGFALYFFSFSTFLSQCKK